MLVGRKVFFGGNSYLSLCHARLKLFGGLLLYASQQIYNGNSVGKLVLSELLGVGMFLTGYK